MTTEWSHLPNAAHIDAVLASVKANPDEWSAALDAARGAARGATWHAARGAAWSAALGAVIALVAYDDCAHMLDSEPDDLRILSKLGSNAATLMIPASIAFKSIREKQEVVL